MQENAEFTSRDLRDAVGLFATGIGVVTARDGEQVHGMTFNSFTSVSLDPPLILLCVDHGAALLKWLERVPTFAISFLTREQEAHSRKFAGQRGAEDLTGPLFTEHHDAPFIVGAAGGLRCTLHQSIVAGDHTIVLGRVLATWRHDQPAGPLLYYRGRYEQGHF